MSVSAWPLASGRLLSRRHRDHAVASIVRPMILTTEGLGHPQLVPGLLCFQVTDRRKNPAARARNTSRRNHRIRQPHIHMMMLFAREAASARCRHCFLSPQEPNRYWLPLLLVAAAPCRRRSLSPPLLVAAAPRRRRCASSPLLVASAPRRRRNCSRQQAIVHGGGGRASEGAGAEHFGRGNVDESFASGSKGALRYGRLAVRGTRTRSTLRGPGARVP